MENEIYNGDKKLMLQMQIEQDLLFSQIEKQKDCQRSPSFFQPEIIYEHDRSRLQDTRQQQLELQRQHGQQNQQQQSNHQEVEYYQQSRHNGVRTRIPTPMHQQTLYPESALPEFGQTFQQCSNTTTQVNNGNNLPQNHCAVFFVEETEHPSIHTISFSLDELSSISALSWKSDHVNKKSDPDHLLDSMLIKMKASSKECIKKEFDFKDSYENLDIVGDAFVSTPMDLFAKLSHVNVKSTSNKSRTCPSQHFPDPNKPEDDSRESSQRSKTSPMDFSFDYDIVKEQQEILENIKRQQQEKKPVESPTQDNKNADSLYRQNFPSLHFPLLQPDISQVESAYDTVHGTLMMPASIDDDSLIKGQQEIMNQIRKKQLFQNL